MNQKLMTIFARTPVSVGCGSSVGAIDSPVMRERHTRYPLIPGSSIKGVLRDLWEEGSAEQNTLFGQQESAGRLLVGEGRLLAFPLRSAKGAFAWITCPLALERFKRDSRRDFTIPAVTEMKCFACRNVTYETEKKAVLEEYCFQVEGEVNGEILKAFSDLSEDPIWQESLGERLVILSDEMFSYFVENACEVVTRIQIDDESGTVKDGHLFSQEEVPSESMFYAVMAEMKEGILDPFCSKIAQNSVIQFGGDETVGLGYCSVKICD